MVLIPTNFKIITDNWVTLNIYSGINLLDHLLLDLYDDIIDLINRGVIKSFFFVRYQDPDFHLRLRFCLANLTLLDQLLFVFKPKLQVLVEELLIWKVFINGYDREVIRYGEDTVKIVEDIFFDSSLFILKNIKAISRWELALINFNVVTDLLDYDIQDKHLFCKNSKENFMLEYDFNKDIKKKMALKFQHFYTKFSSILENRQNGVYLEMKDVLFDKFENLSIILKRNKPTSNFMIISSIIHMNLNRIFRNNGRKNEALLYYLLDKYYLTMICRK